MVLEDGAGAGSGSLALFPSLSLSVRKIRLEGNPGSLSCEFQELPFSWEHHPTELKVAQISGLALFGGSWGFDFPKGDG